MSTLYSQVERLVGTDSVNAAQGASTALSADGNTLAVGGPGDTSQMGATWIYIRSGNTWNQQGLKIVGTGSIGTSIRQGVSVSLSADGDTLAVGGSSDNFGVGATWIFVRSGGIWTQQAKLVGTGYVGGPLQGTSVSLSGDGDVVAIGGPNDNGLEGATWIFRRIAGIWTQFGLKLVGSGSIGPASQGSSVSLSQDSLTLAIGGPDDDSDIGATWIFTNDGIAYNQEAKLIGSNSIPNSDQGTSVSLSGDGNTLAVGGPNDDTGVGATWVFTRMAGIWTELDKLIATGAVGAAEQGRSVALSADSDTLAIGGPLDNGIGAVWIYKRIMNVYTQIGQKLVGSGGGMGVARQGASVTLSEDGEILAFGGPRQNQATGAVWVYSQRKLPCIFHRSLVTVVEALSNGREGNDRKKRQKKIEDVRAGDIVLTKDGREIPVIHNLKFGKANRFVMVGRLIIRPDHPIWNFKKGMEEIAELFDHKVVRVKKTNVYSLCTKEREFVLIDGQYVCTWSEKDVKQMACKFEMF